MGFLCFYIRQVLSGGICGCFSVTETASIEPGGGGHRRDEGRGAGTTGWSYHIHAAANLLAHTAVASHHWSGDAALTTTLGDQCCEYLWFSLAPLLGRGWGTEKIEVWCFRCLYILPIIVDVVVMENMWNKYLSFWSINVYLKRFEFAFAQVEICSFN
jgi:hypothetical protein